MDGCIPDRVDGVLGRGRGVLLHGVRTFTRGSFYWLCNYQVDPVYPIRSVHCIPYNVRACTSVGKAIYVWIWNAVSYYVMGS